MLRRWHLMDFGPDLSGLRRSAIVVAETAEDAAALCQGTVVVPIPVETPAGAVYLRTTRTPDWVDAS